MDTKYLKDPKGGFDLEYTYSFKADADETIAEILGDMASDELILLNDDLGDFLRDIDLIPTPEQELEIAQQIVANGDSYDERGVLLAFNDSYGDMVADLRIKYLPKSEVKFTSVTDADEQRKLNKLMNDGESRYVHIRPDERPFILESGQTGVIAPDMDTFGEYGYDTWITVEAI